MRRPGIDAQRARVTLLVLAVVIAVGVAPFVTGILGAAVLYVIVVPAFRLMRRVIREPAAAGIAVFIAVVLLLVPAAWLVIIGGANAPAIVREVSTGEVARRLASLYVGGVDIGEQLRAGTSAFLSWVSGRLWSLAGSATHSVINGVIAIFGLYYLLLDGDRAWTKIRLLLPFSAESADHLLARFVRVTEAMLAGILATGVVQGMMVGTAFWIVGLAHPIFWGTVAAAASVMPTLGAALVWLPGVAALVITGRTGSAVALGMVGFLIVSTVDNVIRPVVYRRVSHIHPLMTVIGAFAGMYWFGLVGLLLGPLALCYFQEILVIVQKEYGTTVPHDASGRSDTPDQFFDRSSFQTL